MTYRIGKIIKITNNEGTGYYRILRIFDDSMQLRRLSDQWLVSIYAENYNLIG